MEEILSSKFNNVWINISIITPVFLRFRCHSCLGLETIQTKDWSHPESLSKPTQYWWLNFPLTWTSLMDAPHTRFQAHIRNIIPLLKTEGARLYLALFPEKKKGFQSTFYSNWPKKWEARANIQYSSSYQSCQQAKRNFRFCGWQRISKRYFHSQISSHHFIKNFSLL